MEIQSDKSRILLIALVSIATSLAVLFIFRTNAFKSQLKNEKVKSESFLSEKLLLSESLNKLKTELASINGKNLKLDALVVETKNELIKKEKEINRILSENTTVKKLKAKNMELEALRDKLNDELMALGYTNKDLIGENERLNKSLLLSNQENESLKNDNLILKGMLADNYRTEAVKGKKNKLTSYAWRTDKLVVSFDLPDDAGNAINFKIITPEGEELSSMNNKSMTINNINYPVNLTAGTNNTLPINEKRIEMIYKPEKKLKAGVYRFNIYNDCNYLGGTQLRLK